MESDMKILPINTDPETHINFYLSMILTNENMRAWFYERYINLVMYEDIIDFIDNINYSGIIGHVRSYSWDEGKQRGICKVIKEVIQGNGFLNFWMNIICRVLLDIKSNISYILSLYMAMMIERKFLMHGFLISDEVIGRLKYCNKTL